VIARKRVRLVAVVTASVLSEPVAVLGARWSLECPGPAGFDEAVSGVLTTTRSVRKWETTVHCYVDIGVPAMLDIGFHERSPPA